MRAHLKSLAVLVVLALVGLIALRHWASRGEAPESKPLSAVEIDAVMAEADYRRVDMPDLDTNILGATAAYAYKGQTGLIVPKYPMVVLSGVVPVHIAFRIGIYGKSCFSKLKIGPPVTDKEWLTALRGVFPASEPGWNDAMWEDPTKLPFVTPVIPSGPGNDPDGDGWHCTPGIFY
ncbi:hypothetical protein O7631_23550 [Micromonospora sp. WMMD967]|uniref:hypothetical protein n=1 Tax=Micromonospora sp. WMMD967 TaxID=3016101 RepID=UPI002417B986|nr:hypothetical protein [Micromonospora sp. WMMD967]MDG4839509.1 hypothetical protein [Micromonospora sp. WMMD967]